MSDLQVRLTELETRIKENEIQAQDHEAKARECREHRNKLKVELSQLHGMIVDSRMVHASEAAAKAAEGARQIAETSASEVSALVDTLNQKIAESTEIIDVLKGLAAKASEEQK